MIRLLILKLKSSNMNTLLLPLLWQVSLTKGKGFPTAIFLNREVTISEALAISFTIILLIKGNGLFNFSQISIITSPLVNYVEKLGI